MRLNNNNPDNYSDMKKICPEVQMFETMINRYSEHTRKNTFFCLWMPSNTMALKDAMYYFKMVCTDLEEKYKCNLVAFVKNVKTSVCDDYVFVCSSDKFIPYLNLVEISKKYFEKVFVHVIRNQPNTLDFICNVLHGYNFECVLGLYFSQKSESLSISVCGV